MPSLSIFRRFFYNSILPHRDVAPLLISRKFLSYYAHRKGAKPSDGENMSLGLLPIHKKVLRKIYKNKKSKYSPKKEEYIAAAEELLRAGLVKLIPESSGNYKAYELTEMGREIIDKLVNKSFNIEISKIIKHISGKEIVPVDENNNDEHKRLIKYIKEALQNIVEKDNKFLARRANDISENTKGECLEDRIVRYCEQIGSKYNLNAKRLREKGYPNIEIRRRCGDKNTVGYVEVKVKSEERKSESSARDFYISPGSILDCEIKSDPPFIYFTFIVNPGLTSKKIRARVPHILVLCNAKKQRSGKDGFDEWVINSYDIYDLYNLRLGIKLEFNANYNHIKKMCKKLASYSKK